MSLGLFKNVIYKICLQIIYLMYMYKLNLALNNQQWLICHKTQLTKQAYYILVCGYFFETGFITYLRREQ